jgi:hypothetical protein
LDRDQERSARGVNTIDRIGSAVFDSDSAPVVFLRIALLREVGLIFFKINLGYSDLLPNAMIEKMSTKI